MRSSARNDVLAGRPPVGRAERPPAVLAVIPARWGSTRFPGKPLHPLAGKPLIRHVWERCLQARSLDRVIVATDDRRIADAVRAFGGEVAMTSPDHRSGTDRIAEVAKKIPGAGWVINIQGDEPFIEPALIDRLVRALVRSGEEMATVATPFAPDESPDNPNAVKVVCRADGTALYFSRSRIPFPRDGAGFRWMRHLGIYGYRRDFLLRFVRWGVSPLESCEQLEQLRALERGASIRVIETPAAPQGVDTPEDATLAESLLSLPPSPPARKKPERKKSL